MGAKKKFKNNKNPVVPLEKVKSAAERGKFRHNLVVPGYLGGVLLLFMIAAGVLIYTPKVVKLTESRLIVSSNVVHSSPKALIADVKGAENPVVTIESHNIAPPQFSAAAVLAQDLNTGQILYQKNIDQKMSPASTTKIMTALVSVKYFKAGDILKVTHEGLVAGSSMGLSLGEKLTYRGLLYGMLLNSGNDAAFTIADNYPGGVGAFVGAMNKRAQELGLENTHFQNPAGFDSSDHYSSAMDLGKIAREAIQDPQIAKVIGTKETSVTSTMDSTSSTTLTTSDSAKMAVNHSHNLKNLNELLGKDGVIGIKTGYTDIAGENFVGLVDRNSHRILTVVLNSNNRFGESKALMDWVYSNYSWKSN